MLTLNCLTLVNKLYTVKTIIKLDFYFFYNQRFWINFKNGKCIYNFTTFTFYRFDSSMFSLLDGGSGLLSFIKIETIPP